MTTIACFTPVGGVGNTSLVYNLGWAFADQGKRVLMVDLDPQSSLTAMCVDEERLEQLWVDDEMKRKSIRGAVQPLIVGVGDVQVAHQEPLHARLALVPGDIRLAELEQELSNAWSRCMAGDPASFRIVTSFYRVIEAAAAACGAEIVLIDVGHNFGAINRSALVAADHVITPLRADLFSIHGLGNLGSTFRRWREEWSQRRVRSPEQDLLLPAGSINPLGYLIMQLTVFRGQVTRTAQQWLRKLPAVYAESVLQQPRPEDLTVENDPSCLAMLRHHYSLTSMAQSARKPVFKLTAADGAIGAHSHVVQQAGAELRSLAKKIADRISLSS